MVNFHVAAREWKDDIIFLRKIVPGRSDRSYGIQVARLAGLPPPVIDRAREILAALERDELTRGGRPSVSGTASDPQRQLGLFQAAAPDDRLRQRLAALEVDQMTPIEALTLLADQESEGDAYVVQAFGPARQASKGPALQQPRLLSVGCLHRPDAEPEHLGDRCDVAGPNNFDPRIGTDDVSGKTAQLIFNNLMTLDDQLRVVPDLAERLDNPDPTTYVATLRRGVMFHDGHELTSADVVFTFRCFWSRRSCRRARARSGWWRQSRRRDRYTVVFTLKEPFGSFPVNLVIPDCARRRRPGVSRAPDRHWPLPVRQLRGRRQDRARRDSTTTSAAARRTTG